MLRSSRTWAARCADPPCPNIRSNTRRVDVRGRGVEGELQQTVFSTQLNPGEQAPT
jgi:hypothetical protein